MWLNMQEPIVVQPRRPQDPGVTHVEIYLPQQVMAVFTDDKPVLIAHISSGDDQEWCETVSLRHQRKGRAAGGACRARRVWRVVHAGRRVPLPAPGHRATGSAPSAAWTTRLLQLRHRHARRQERAADARVARVHPDEPDDLRTRSRRFVHLKDRVYVWGQDGKEPEQYSKRESRRSSTTRTPTPPPPRQGHDHHHRAGDHDATTAKPAVTTTTVKPAATTTTTTKPAPTTTAAPADHVAAPTTPPTSPPTTSGA